MKLAQKRVSLPELPTEVWKRDIETPRDIEIDETLK
jgi:hypothetical protein